MAGEHGSSRGSGMFPTSVSRAVKIFDQLKELRKPEKIKPHVICDPTKSHAELNFRRNERDRQAYAERKAAKLRANCNTLNTANDNTLADFEDNGPCLTDAICDESRFIA